MKRGDTILGVTTAATLWFVTVVGLCFGGGQNALGVAGALMSVGILRGLKLIEHRLRQERPAELRIRWRADDFDSDSALATIGASTLKVSNFAIKHTVAERIEELRCSVRRRMCRASGARRPRSWSSRAGQAFWSRSERTDPGL